MYATRSSKLVMLGGVMIVAAPARAQWDLDARGNELPPERETHLDSTRSQKSARFLYDTFQPAAQEEANAPAPAQQERPAEADAPRPRRHADSKTSKEANRAAPVTPPRPAAPRPAAVPARVPDFVARRAAAWRERNGERSTLVCSTEAGVTRCRRVASMRRDRRR